MQHYDCNVRLEHLSIGEIDPREQVTGRRADAQISHTLAFWCARVNRLAHTLKSVRNMVVKHIQRNQRWNVDTMELHTFIHCLWNFGAEYISDLGTNEWSEREEKKLFICKIKTIHTTIVAPYYPHSLTHTFPIKTMIKVIKSIQTCTIFSTYRPVLVMTISVPIAANESHSPLLSNSASGWSGSPSS